MATGYCTVDDVRRALREKDLPGDVAQDKQILVDAIAAQTEWFEKTYHRHWYVPGGVTEDTEGLIPTGVETRDDEHDIPTQGGYVVGAYDNIDAWTPTTGTAFSADDPDPDPKEQIRLASGDLSDETVPTYTRITLARKDVDAINELHVVNEAGSYDDWVASNDYSGGVGNANRGDDYWVRVNNGGVSELYLDVHAMDDDITAFSNAVYVDLDFGHDGLPRTARRGIAFRAAADLTEQAAIEIPNNSRVYNVESLAEEFMDKADELLSVYETELEG